MHVFTIACAASGFRLTVNLKWDTKRDSLAREKIILLNFSASWIQPSVRPHFSKQISVLNIYLLSDYCIRLAVLVLPCTNRRGGNTHSCFSREKSELLACSGIASSVRVGGTKENRGHSDSNMASAQSASPYRGLG